MQFFFLFFLFKSLSIYNCQVSPLGLSMSANLRLNENLGTAAWTFYFTITCHFLWFCWAWRDSFLAVKFWKRKKVVPTSSHVFSTWMVGDAVIVSFLVIFVHSWPGFYAVFSLFGWFTSGSNNGLPIDCLIKWFLTLVRRSQGIFLTVKFYNETLFIYLFIFFPLHTWDLWIFYILILRNSYFYGRIFLCLSGESIGISKSTERFLSNYYHLTAKLLFW